MRTTLLQTTFASGELDPLLRAQTGIEAYNQGARQLRNLRRLATGGVERRVGTLMLDPLGAKSRLEPFIFSDDERYLLAFYEGGLDVFDEDGVYLDSVAGAAWLEADLWIMSISQSADVAIITCDNFMQKLVRQSIDTFVLEDFAFTSSPGGTRTYQPYYKFSADDLTLTPAADSGSGIAITASTAFFDALHDGVRFRIHDKEVEIASVTDGTNATIDIKEDLEATFDLDPFKTSKGTALVEVQHLLHGFTNGATIVLSGSNDLATLADGTGGIPSTSVDGSRVITLIDEHHYKFTAASGSAEQSEDCGGPNVKYSVAGVAVTRFEEAAFSTLRGYPRAGAFHQNRYWCGGTPSLPDSVFGSNVFQPFRFDVGQGLDADSVQAVGATGSQIAQIKHIVSNDDLFVMSSTGERVFATRPGEPVVGSTPLRQASNIGSADIAPQVFDSAVLFVSPNAKSVYELIYSDQMGRYAPTQVSLLAHHLLESGIVDSAVSNYAADRNEEYAFFPVGDGSIAVFHSMRAENIAGWVQWRLGNGWKVESMASVGETVFAVAYRSDKGRYLIKFGDDAERYELDLSVELTSETETVDWVAPVTHRGRTLALNSERGYLGTYVVPPDGVIVTRLPVTRLSIGEPYLATLETVTPRIDTPAGPRDRMVKRILRAMIEFDRTYSAVVNGRPLVLRSVGEDPLETPLPFSGSRTFRGLGYRRSPTLTITQEEPRFMRVLGITMEVAF